MWAIEYHGHIWQVLSQLSCYFANFAYEEIDQRSSSNPQRSQGTILSASDRNIPRATILNMLYNIDYKINKSNQSRRKFHILQSLPTGILHSSQPLSTSTIRHNLK